jgi:hypothetical protein
MKRTLVIIAFTLICLGSAHAKIAWGLRGGLNVARLELTSNGQSIDTSSALGLHAGAFLKLATDSPLIIQPELLYTQKGTQANVSDVVTIDYIALPILIKYNIQLPQISQVLIQPFIAPELAYAVSASSTYNPDFYDSINKLNSGFNFGADLVYTDNYMLGLRYFLGMSELEKGAKREPISNSCWSVSIGYNF